MHEHIDKHSIFRVDRFAVPVAAREEFLTAVKSTRDFLDTLDGCVQNVILERSAGPESSSILTIVEWRDADAFAEAKAAAAARYAASGFKPQALLSRLGITAELADYAVSN